MGKIDTKRVAELSELIGNKARRLAQDRQILAEMRSGKISISVNIGNRSIDVVKYEHTGHRAMRGREMFDLAARKLLAGMIDTSEAELHELQRQLAAAMRGEA